MYHCKLAITIFSCDESWLPRIKNIEPLENLEYHPVLLSIVDDEALRCSDVIIVDLPLSRSLPHLRSGSKRNAVLIFCGDAGQIAGLTPDELAACDDIWAKPFTEALTVHRLKQVFSRIKLRKDHFLMRSYLDTAIDSIPDLVWFKDIQGVHVKVNDAFCHAVGKTKADVQGRGHYYIWDLKPEDYAAGEYICLESEEVVLAARKTCVFDEKVKSRQGMRQFKTYKSPVFDEDGELIGTLGVAHDVTDLGNMTVELKIILQSMPFAIMVYDHTGRITDVNEKFVEYFGVDSRTIIGTDVNEWKKSVEKEAKINDSGKTEISLDNNGVIRMVEISEEPIVDVFDSYIGTLFICRDVTKERSFEQCILLSANTDALTGLYNRRFFYEKIEECRQVPQVSLLYIDMDNFKLINDLYGHQTGDDTLKAVSDILRSCCPDDLICRIGGDEFLVAVLDSCSEEALKNKAATILRTLQQQFEASDTLKVLSASIGIAYTTDSDMPTDHLIRQSDVALLAAKRSGKAQYHVYSEALQDVVDRRGR